MTSRTALAHFDTLQTAVLEALEEHCKERRADLRSPLTLLRVATLIGYLISVVLGLLSASAVLNSVTEHYASTAWSPILLNYKPLIMAAFFFVWGPLAAFPFMYLREDRYSTRLVRLAKAIQAFVLAPLWLVILAYLVELTLGDGVTFAELWQIYQIFLRGLLPLPLLTVALLVGLSLSGSPPSVLLLILGIYSRDKVSAAVVSKTEFIVKQWSSTERREVEWLASQRPGHLNLQLQTLSFTLAPLGLIGLLGLILSAESIKLHIAGFVNTLSNSTTPEATAISQVALMVIALVVGGVLYFLESYRVTRAVEIVHLLCAEELNAEEPQVPTQLTVQAPAEPMRAAPQPLPFAIAAVMVGALLSLVWYMMDLLPGRRGGK